ncbi:MAG: glycosyltransferase family 87 protein [Myxococcota bacterium]
MRWRPLLHTVAPQASAILVLFLLGWTWIARIPYPYDLEWMEGGMLAHAWRLDRGLPLYGPPSAEFVPYIYPPGYSALLALLGKVFGLSPPLGRVVSALGTLAAAGSITFSVRKLGGTLPVALGAAAVFLGTYPATGAFFDLVRPDGLCVGLLGWAVALVWVDAKWAPPVSGALLVAAFLVKHNAAVFGVPLLLAFGGQRGWRSGAAFAAASILPALAAVGVLQVTSDGWFLRYLVELPRSHPVPLDRIVLASPREWGTPLPVAIAAITGAVLWSVAERPGPVPRAVATFAPVLAGTLASAIGTYVRPPPDSGQLNMPSSVAFFAAVAIPVAVGIRAVGWAAERRLPSWSVGWWLVVGAVASGFAAYMRAHAGGFLNVHIPMYYVVALAFGAACVWAARRWPHENGAAAIGAVITLQLAWSIARFDRARLVPTARDYQAGEKVVAAMAQVEGDVLSPLAAWLPVYAGKPPSLHHQGLWDLELSRGPLKETTEVVREGLRARRWGAVVLGNQKFPYPVAGSYREQEQILEPKSKGLMPKTGYRARPERLLVPAP